MRALVSEGASFIDSELAKQLVKVGANFTVLDKRASSTFREERYQMRKVSLV